MSDTPDFYTRATEQLRTMAGDDTVVLATINGERMHMQTRTPRGPRELVHIARRLLEEARDQFDEISTSDTADAGERAYADDRIEDIEAAIEDLIDADALGEGEV